MTDEEKVRRVRQILELAASLVPPAGYSVCPLSG